MSIPSISIVTPCYNEEENVKPLYDRLIKVLGYSSRFGSYEIIFVENGSLDRSFFVLQEMAKENTKIKIIRLSRNFGFQMAITSGLAHASGNRVVVMDCDLQDPPELIPQLWDKMEQGFEVVYAIRAKRKESLFRRVSFYLFYRLLAAISDTRIPLDAGDFGIYERCVVDVISHMPERNRFIRGLRAWTGFRQSGVEYDRPERSWGETKFNFHHMYSLAMDGLIAFSYYPLRLMMFAGIFILGLTALGAAITIILKLLHPGVLIPGLAQVSVLMIIFGGLNLFCLGVIGEYVGRIYEEVKRRPMYIIRELVNLKRNSLGENSF